MTSSKRAVLERLYALAPRGALLGLERVHVACAALGHPERRFASVHIAGTNGKGSVAAMVDAMARAAGLRVGLYTSPQLVRFAERIQVGGEPVSDDQLVASLEGVLDRFPELTFFETATVAAFVLFADTKVELAVVEVGLGGRLDATNVLEAPRATAITRIALDHTDRLGSDLASIAREKAGILKPSVPAVLGPLDAISMTEVRAVAERVNAPLRLTAGDDELASFVARHPPGLAGAHQIENAQVAVALAQELALPIAAMARGLGEARWPGRMETLATAEGPVLLDAAHNPDGARALAFALATEARDPAQVALVFGAMADKDAFTMLTTLAPHALHRFYVSPEGRRAIDPAELRASHSGVVAADVPDALARARATVGPEGLILVTGSIFLVGAVRAHLLGLPRDPAVAL
ncbi:MAG TPA: folylpolyglutamate synthase/dihydrofolate synthase family protein [Polyangiaceae bacterium]|nr:folylpolyglutamate synthase/dihydrofolate synthase family protein [Polyangiaceae bacterium]